MPGIFESHSLSKFLDIKFISTSLGRNILHSIIWKIFQNMLVIHYIASGVKCLEYGLDILIFFGLHDITSGVKSLEYCCILKPSGLESDIGVAKSEME